MSAPKRTISDPIRVSAKSLNLPGEGFVELFVLIKINLIDQM